MPTDFTSLRPDIAACGLYCGACRKFRQGKCPGCRDNAKANWCKIRQCCTAHHYSSCADCTLIPLEACKKFNNPIAKIFALVFRPIARPVSGVSVKSDTIAMPLK